MVEGIVNVFFIPPVLPGRFWFAAAFSKGVTNLPTSDMGCASCFGVASENRLLTLSGISNLQQPGILLGAAFTGETLTVTQIHRAFYSRFGCLEL